MEQFAEGFVNVDSVRSIEIYNALKKAGAGVAPHSTGEGRGPAANS
jgi:hypothetical protein